jgi:hypothetical protein
MSSRQEPAERRIAEPLLYTFDQARGHTPIRLRRREDKIRLLLHAAGVVAALLLAAWWVIPQHSFSGPVLAEFTPGRGVHLADAVTVAFLAIAVSCGRAALRALERLGP